MQVDAHTTLGERLGRYLLRRTTRWHRPRKLFLVTTPSGPQKPELQTRQAPLGAKCRPLHATPSSRSTASSASARCASASDEGDGRWIRPWSEGCVHIPRYAPFIGAGFRTSTCERGALLTRTYLYFMGEELTRAEPLHMTFSVRLEVWWPTRICANRSRSSGLTKVHRAVAPQLMQKFVLPRVKHMVGYPRTACVFHGFHRWWGTGGREPAWSARPVSVYVNYMRTRFCVTAASACRAWKGYRPSRRTVHGQAQSGYYVDIRRTPSAAVMFEGRSEMRLSVPAYPRFCPNHRPDGGGMEDERREGSLPLSKNWTLTTSGKRNRGVRST